MLGVLDAVADHLMTGGSAFASPEDVARHIEPRTIQTPALDLIDRKLIDAYEGRGKRRLIISMPPQEGKSQRISRFFPTWLLKQNPDLRIAIVSYADALARRWGRAIRNDLRDNPDIGLTVRHDTSAANEWQLAHYAGGVITAGIESGLTGRPVDVLIIDDPLKGRAEADSETYREMNKDWWRSVASSRFSEDALVVLVMTRWHEDDLAGFLSGPEYEGRADWDVLNIPAQADHSPERGETDPLGREPGEYMISARGRTAAGWEQRKRDAGSRDWTALYQGRPAPAEGGVLKRGWWTVYDVPRAVERPDGTWHALGADQVLLSWDMAFKDTDGSDYVVGQVWARKGPRAWLLEQVRDRMDFSRTLAEFAAQAARWPQARLKLVEDKANGPAAINQLQKTIGGIVPFSPTDSKLARAYAMQPFLEAGNFELPAPAIAPWVGGFIDECAAFPNGSHDDRVDAFTQAGIRMFVIGGGLDAFMAELAGQQGAHGPGPEAPHTVPWETPAEGAPAVSVPDTAQGEDMRPPWLRT